MLRPFLERIKEIWIGWVIYIILRYVTKLDENVKSNLVERVRFPLESSRLSSMDRATDF